MGVKPFPGVMPRMQTGSESLQAKKLDPGDGLNPSQGGVSLFLLAPTTKQRETEKDSRAHSVWLSFSLFLILAGWLRLFLRGGRKQAVHAQMHREPGVVIGKISDDRQGRSKTRDLLAAEKRDHFGQIGIRHF